MRQDLLIAFLGKGDRLMPVLYSKGLLTPIVFVRP